MNKKIVRKSILSVALLCAISTPLIVWEHKRSTQSNQVVTASGVIEDKRSVNYQCGTAKSPQTCTDYLLSINGKEHNVNSNTFSKNTVGNNITLVKTETNYNKGQLFIAFMFWCVGCFLLFSLYGLYWVVGFLLWIFDDTKLPFRKWMNY